MSARKETIEKEMQGKLEREKQERSAKEAKEGQKKKLEQNTKEIDKKEKARRRSKEMPSNASKYFVIKSVPTTSTVLDGSEEGISSHDVFEITREMIINNHRETTAPTPCCMFV